MSDLFDRAFGPVDDDDETRTVTSLDIADLPDPQRQVMFTFLRDAKETFGELTLETLRDKHTDLDDLPGILDDLTNLDWLTRLGEAPNVRYKARLGRRRKSRLSDALWASLSEDSGGDSTPSTDDTQTNDRPSLPSLSDW